MMRIHHMNFTRNTHMVRIGRWWHTLNPSTWEAESGGSLRVPGQPGLQRPAWSTQRNPVSFFFFLEKESRDLRCCSILPGHVYKGPSGSINSLPLLTEVLTAHCQEYRSWRGCGRFSLPCVPGWKLKCVLRPVVVLLCDNNVLVNQLRQRNKSEA